MLINIQENVKSASELFVGSGRARGCPSLAGGPPGTDFGSILDGLLVIFLIVRQICKPLENNFEAFLWGRPKKKEKRKIKNGDTGPLYFTCIRDGFRKQSTGFS